MPEENEKARRDRVPAIRKWVLRILIIGLIISVAVIFKDLLAFLFLPLIIALILIYIGLPLVKRLEKRLGRPASIFTYLLIIVLVLLALVGLAFPEIAREWSQFAAELPKLKTSLQQLIVQIAGAEVMQSGNSWLASLPEKTSAAIGNTMLTLFDMLPQMAKTASNALLAPVFVFLILRDREYFANTTLFILPKKLRGSVLDVCARIKKEVDRFLKGQLVLAAISGAILMAGLLLSGLNFPVLIGILAVILGFIPFIGSVLGAIPAILLALTQGGNVLLFTGITILIQQIALNLIGPSIMARSLNMHPVYSFIILIAGGFLGGIIGFIISIPVAIIVRSAIGEIYNIHIARKTA